MIERFYASASILEILGEGIRILPYKIGDIMKKYCKKCNSKVDISLFYKCNAKKDGKSSNCKECDNKAKALWRSKNQDKVIAYEKKRWELKDRNSKKRIDDRARSQKNRIEMSDSYMRELITKKSNLNPEDLSDEFIEMCRLNLKLKRVLGLTPKLKPPT